MSRRAQNTRRCRCRQSSDKNNAERKSQPVPVLADEKILSDLFFILVKKSWVDRDASRVGEKSFLYALSHVCSQWRHIVLNIPVLWSRIHIPISFQPDLTRLWFQRSRTCPIDFRLTAIYDEETRCLPLNVMDNPAAARPRFQALHDLVLAPNVNKFRTILICSMTRKREEALRWYSFRILDYFKEYPDPLPKLRGFFFDAVDLEGDVWSDEPPRRTKAILPKGANSLEAARIDYSLELPSREFACLRRLEVTVNKLLPVELHWIVRQCPALTTLVIDGDFTCDCEELENKLNSLPPFEVPRLETLQLNLKSRYYLKFASLFSNTPCRHIIFPQCDWRGRFHKEYPLGSGTFRALETLSIIVEDMFSDEAPKQKGAIRAFSQTFPWVSAVNIEGIEDDVLSVLESAEVWPELRTLGLPSATADFLTGPAGCSLQLRKEAGKPIEKLAVNRQTFSQVQQDDSWCMEGLVDIVVAEKVKVYWPELDWEDR